MKMSLPGNTPLSPWGLPLSGPVPRIRTLLCPRTGTPNSFRKGFPAPLAPPEGPFCRESPDGALSRHGSCLGMDKPSQSGAVTGPWGYDMTGRLLFFLVLVVMIWILPRLM